MRTFRYRVNVHGHAFFLEYPGPGHMRNVENVDWSDQQGLRRGWGVTFRAQPNRDNYFHVSLPVASGLPLFNPYEQTIQDSVSRWYSVRLTFQLNGPAQLFHLGFFDGRNRFHTLDRRPNLGISSRQEVVIPIERRRSPSVAFGLSVGINFGQPDSSVLFEGVEATFETVFIEPSDPRP
jgi:hypothetical protein